MCICGVISRKKVLRNSLRNNIICKIEYGEKAKKNMSAYFKTIRHMNMGLCNKKIVLHVCYAVTLSSVKFRHFSVEAGGALLDP